MAALLDADVLVAAARDATGLDDLGEDGWREGLDRLVTALCDEAALSDRGVMAAAGDLVGHLTTRLQVVDWHRRHPALARDDVTPPVVIVGQARTGTTILFDLLAQDPAHRLLCSFFRGATRDVNRRAKRGGSPARPPSCRVQPKRDYFAEPSVCGSSTETPP